VGIGKILSIINRTNKNIFPFPYTPRISEEIRRRIRLTFAAYAYEFENEFYMSDEEFDKECKLVDLSIDTQRPDLDEYFRKEFKPYTGQWIHSHPDLNEVRQSYKELCFFKKGLKK
jgi:tRNA/tmRNA/rRNA uracil-C5-methylase (TrmA/RlmC/RlmD family)